jgi:Protein of unknown function (DUF998)
LSLGRARALGVVGTAGPVVFTLDWLLLGFTHLEYAPRRETISALSAHDAPGWAWMVAGQVAMVAGCLAIAALVRAALGRRGRAGAVLMVLAGYGIVQASAFRTICNRSDSAWCTPLPRSAYPDQQWLHGTGTGVAFGSLLLGCLAVAWAAWGARLVVLAAVSATAGMISLPLVAWFLSNAESSWHGFAEKLFLITLAGWATYVGHRLAAQIRP